MFVVLCHRLPRYGTNCKLVFEALRPCHVGAALWHLGACSLQVATDYGEPAENQRIRPDPGRGGSGERDCAKTPQLRRQILKPFREGRKDNGGRQRHDVDTTVPGPESLSV